MPMMPFQTLLAEAGLPAETRGLNPAITDVQADSRRCGPGVCFVAIRGTQVDGHRFIADVIARGTSAIVCEDPTGIPADVPHLVVPDTKAALGPLAQGLLGWPARKLIGVAITGTNGKSTVAHLIHAVLAEVGIRAGLVGTIVYDTGAGATPATMTTPDPVALARMTDEMVRAGATHLVMEASSHALHQNRLAGLSPQVGVFTNLTGDHLDYHGTMEEYLAAKRLLFESMGPEATAILNGDDPASDAMAAATQATVCRFGLSPLADLQARIETIDHTGTTFTMRVRGETYGVTTSLIGRHNVYNALAALGVCDALGVPLAAAADAMSRAGDVPGRLQRIPTPPQRDIEVFVDYAHTDDALKNVLSALRPITRNRLLVLFGCGGDRDKTKRPRMARVAASQADVLFVTSDNPRTEDPQAILDDVLAGLDPAGRSKAHVEVDRRAAIALAIAQARPGDVVLVAGKGHETYQILGQQHVHFDDAEEVAACLTFRENRA